MDYIELMNAFSSSNLQKIEIKEADCYVKMQKADASARTLSEDFSIIQRDSLAADSLLRRENSPRTEDANASKDRNEVRNSEETKEFFPITSPIVGTYYASSRPEDAPYVCVGDTVEEGQVLCMIEAMKMFHEIKSPVRGVVRKIHPETASFVEFAQVLLEIEVIDV